MSLHGMRLCLAGTGQSAAVRAGEIGRFDADERTAERGRLSVRGVIL